MLGFFIVICFYNKPSNTSTASKSLRSLANSVPPGTATNQASIVNHQDDSNGTKQSTRLIAQAAAAIEGFQRLPFQPEYGDEVFDEATPLTEEARRKWKRHCILRGTYASKRIHEPTFLQLYRFTEAYGLSDDIVKLQYLHAVAYSLGLAKQHATDYSPELVSEETKADLREFLLAEIDNFRRIVANIYGIEVDDEFMEGLMQIRPKGLIDTSSTHVQPGERWV